MHAPGQPEALLHAALSQIVCPVCHGQLTLNSATVHCVECHRRYPVEDGIPVLLGSRAYTPEDASSM